MQATIVYGDHIVGSAGGELFIRYFNLFQMEKEAKPHLHNTNSLTWRVFETNKY